MSARQRADRATKAIAEGVEAFKQGKPASACPYKVSDWGTGGDWLLGWSRAKQQSTAGVNDSGNETQA